MPGFAPTSAPKSTIPTTVNVPQPRDVAMPDFTSNTYVPFAVACTGDLTTSLQAVWSPRETRFVLRGGYIHVLCGVTCAGTPVAGWSVGELLFYDEDRTNVVLPITNYHITSTLAGWVNAITPWHFDLGKGYRSKLKNNRLVIGGTIGIGAGQLYCSGMLWGIQE